MKKIILTIGFLLCLCFFSDLIAQCSICTKTAQQMGEKVGEGFNAGILYLAAAPIGIIGFIGYKWYKSNKD